MLGWVVGGPPRRARRWPLLAVLALAMGLVPPPPDARGEAARFELTQPVRESLRRLQFAWQRWVTGYYGQDRSVAETALEEILSIADFLGMPRLPDLSLAAGAYAVRSARDGDFERAEWALETAERLDPGRPETHFAAAAVRRVQGNYPASALRLARGYSSLVHQPRERALWLHGAALWGLYVLLVSGAFYLAVLMAARGRRLLDALHKQLSPRLAPWPAALALIALLTWPLLLPRGLLWLAFLWSVLIWRYVSTSQKVVLAAIWLMLGATPLLMALQSRYVQVELSPPARLLDRFAAARLYGSLFEDLETLTTLMPESPAVDELEADLYRQLGQWEHARALYTQLESLEPKNAAVQVNLGLYHYQKRDYKTAMRYFDQAIDLDPKSAEAFYNKSQAQAHSYDFSGSQAPLSRAHELAPEQISEWIELEKEGVAVDGGIRRIPAIKQALFASWISSEGQGAGTGRWLRRYLSLAMAAAVALGGGLFDRLARRLNLGAGASRPVRRSPDRRWLRVLLPGLAAAERGQGGRAYLALVPLTLLLLLPFARGLGYRSPLGVDPGHWLVLLLAMLPLVLWLALRLGKELRR